MDRFAFLGWLLLQLEPMTVWAMSLVKETRHCRWPTTKVHSFGFPPVVSIVMVVTVVGSLVFEACSKSIFLFVWNQYATGVFTYLLLRHPCYHRFPFWFLGRWMVLLRLHITH